MFIAETWRSSGARNPSLFSSYKHVAALRPDLIPADLNFRRRRRRGRKTIRFPAVASVWRGFDGASRTSYLG